LPLFADERRGRRRRSGESQQKQDAPAAKTSQHGARARRVAGPAEARVSMFGMPWGPTGGRCAVCTVALDFFAASQVDPVAWRVRPSSPAVVCPKRRSAGPTTAVQRRLRPAQPPQPGGPNSLQTGTSRGAAAQTGRGHCVTRVQPGPTGPKLGPNLTQTCPNSDAIRSNRPKLHCQSGPQVVYDRAFVHL
jgi:hypothetical protein